MAVFIEKKMLVIKKNTLFCMTLVKGIPINTITLFLREKEKKHL